MTGALFSVCPHSVYVPVCSCATALHCRLLAGDTYYSVLSCSRTCKDTKERPFHFESLPILVAPSKCGLSLLLPPPIHSLYYIRRVCINNGTNERRAVATEIAVPP